MEAAVTIKATPSELDTVRAALDLYEQENVKISRATRAEDTTPQQRRDAAAEAIKANDLLNKLR